ncbi:MAG: hypothetical protein K2N23_02635 [Clostridia bacterium]|nr:hypothetical protein [Clostridia bacterium]
MKLRDYKFGFNLSALVLFALIMLPNIIWFCVPAQNDVLRGESSTQILDIFASIFQVATIAALCILKNKNAEKLRFSVFLIICGVFCALYYICWIIYYCAVVHTTVLIGLSVFPCISFALYAVDRKNYIALIPTVIFAVLHFTSTAINFF